MKYTVKLSYLQNEADTGYTDVEYIVTAQDLNTAKNKGIIKLIKEYNPYHFNWNEAHQCTKGVLVFWKDGKRIRWQE
jgi:hypothetical protein